MGVGRPIGTADEVVARPRGLRLETAPFTRLVVILGGPPSLSLAIPFPVRKSGRGDVGWPFKVGAPVGDRRRTYMRRRPKSGRRLVFFMQNIYVGVRATSY